MREYEIRVLKGDRTLSLSMLTMQFSVSSAIREGRVIAHGMAFEVWRDDDRVYYMPPDGRAPAPDAPLALTPIQRS